MGETLLDGRYRMIARLDAGGMGEVWRCRDERIGRDVAVKLLRDVQPSDEVLARFDREARTAGALASPRIVTIHDYGHGAYDGRTVPYLVMELVSGRTVAQLLAADELVAIDTALAWAGQVCEALELAHGAGVIHRDIKPGNIMITDAGTTKVLDFGIARFLETQLVGNAMTATGVFIGTAEYMSPEQVNGRRLDGRTDLYSLGCLLYALVTGGPPFSGETFVALAYQHASATPQPPSTHRLGVVPELDALVMELLAKDPDDRPGDAAAVRARLADVAAATAAAERAEADAEVAARAAAEARAEELARVEAEAAERQRVAEEAAALAEEQARAEARAEAAALAVAAAEPGAPSPTPATAEPDGATMVSRSWSPPAADPETHVSGGRGSTAPGVVAGNGGAAAPTDADAQSGTTSTSRRAILVSGVVGLVGATVGGGVVALLIGDKRSGSGSVATGSTTGRGSSPTAATSPAPAGSAAPVPAATAATLTGHQDSVLGVSFSADGQYLATASKDASVRLWNIADPAAPALATTLSGHTADVLSAVFNQDRTIIATGSADHTTRLWKISDPANPTQLSTLRTLTPATMLTGHTNYVCCVAFNPADKGRFLATASHDATSRYYDVLDPLNPVPVTDFVNPKGATPIVPGATDHDAMRWVSFSPDGRVLATCGTLGTASVDHVVRLWDLADPVAHQVLAEFPNGIGGTWCAVFSPDGETLATVGEDHTIRLWNVSDPGHPTLTATLPGHTDVTQTLAYSPDGKLLASGSRDKTARLWNVADPKTPTAAAKLEGHAANVGSVAFSPDGKLLATASDDKTARIWRLG